MILNHTQRQDFVGRALRLARGAIQRQAMRLPYNNNKKNRP